MTNQESNFEMRAIFESYGFLPNRNFVSRDFKGYIKWLSSWRKEAKNLGVEFTPRFVRNCVYNGGEFI